MPDPESTEATRDGKPDGDAPDGKARFLRDDMEYEDGDFVCYSVTIALPEGVSFRDTEEWGNALAAFANALNDTGRF